MSNSVWRMIGVSALLLGLGMLTTTLPGCDGGGGTSTGPNEVVKNAPPVNPAKGALDEEPKTAPSAK